jgi:hypothetical protein
MRVVFLTFALLVALPAGVSAQVLSGRVLEAGTERGIPLASVVLLDDRERVLVEGAGDSGGAFRLRGWEAGKYRLRASALGYETVTSDLFELVTGEEIVLNVELGADAIPLEPITVVSRSRSTLRDIALRGYLDRRDSGRRIGMGRFLDRGEIEEKATTRLSDVLMKVPGLRVVRSGPCVVIGTTSNLGGMTPRRGSCGSRVQICRAAIYLDGQNLGYDPTMFNLDQMIPLSFVEAIEVYRRPSELPAEFMGVDTGGCGVVAIWTRRG